MPKQKTCRYDTASASSPKNSSSSSRARPAHPRPERGGDAARCAEATNLRHHERARGDRAHREEVEEQYSVEGDELERLGHRGAARRAQVEHRAAHEPGAVPRPGDLDDAAVAAPARRGLGQLGARVRHARGHPRDRVLRAGHRRRRQGALGHDARVPDPDEGMEYPQRRYQVYLKSTSGPVEVFLVSQLEGDGADAGESSANGAAGRAAPAARAASSASGQAEGMAARSPRSSRRATRTRGRPS